MTGKWFAALWLAVAALGTAMNAAQSADHPRFAGVWELSAEQSINLGMMSPNKISLVIAQTANTLAVKETSVFQGKPSDRVFGYDLTGKPVSNPSQLGGGSETVAHWEGDKLVVTWTSQGTLEGTKLVRTETRSLSADGRTMSVQMASGEGPAVIMVFARKK